MRPKIHLYACAIVLVFATTWTRAITPAERLTHAAEMNSLDDASMEPWYLKLSFQLFDEKGAPTEKGVIEEWWKSPSQHKTVYTSPSYTSMEIQTADGTYRSKGTSSPPYLLNLALQQVIHPIPQEDIADAKPDQHQQAFGKVALDCITLSQPIKNIPYPPLGLFPTYCFDSGRDDLRLLYNLGSELTTRNNQGKFRERYVSLDQVTTVNSVTAVTAHIEELRTATMAESEFVPPDVEKIDMTTVKVGAGVMAGMILTKLNPIYPVRARQNRISGRVVIAVKIGRDGRIHSMKLVSAPDADLAIAALTAVRQWIYKPYLLNGEPVEVDTMITVNFDIG
jgi:TonB family protein